MFIETRVLGRTKRPLDDWSVPAPPPDDRDGGDGGMTLRALITHVVRAEVASFAQRQRKMRLLRVLSPAEIEQGSARGKLIPGGQSLGAIPDIDQAIGVALQGFQDGLFPVIVDGGDARRARPRDLRAARLGNVEVKRQHVTMGGTIGSYVVHLGSAMASVQPGSALPIIAVHSQQRGRMFLPFADDDPRTAEVLSKVLLLARDAEIRDPNILEWIRMAIGASGRAMS